MLAVMKFFLGQDQKGDGDGSDDEGGEGGSAKAADEEGHQHHMPTKQDVYNSSKKVRQVIGLTIREGLQAWGQGMRRGSSTTCLQSRTGSIPAIRCVVLVCQVGFQN